VVVVKARLWRAGHMMPLQQLPQLFL